MKNSRLKISIEKPCNKINWTSMSDYERGKFCSICSKNVMDFSKMTDEEIVNYLNGSEESICARLNQSQMNRNLNINKANKINHWNKIAATLALMTLTTVSYSNTNKDNYYKTELNIRDLPHNKGNFYTQISSIDSIPNIIKGKVVEEGWDYPVKTFVIVKGTKIKSETDSLGNFQIVIPKKYKKEEIILIVKSTGLENDTELNLKISELPKNEIVITKNPMVIGEVIRIKWWQFWK
ncbi:hypothetical protein Q4534_23795 [Cyclobacterium sp. 1_MG-2023]|uniref:hypothetical protein n=1 Tax=Cyclobacterium sp. 1_MG-2023 TaxID=3062681 RepID=UPI0026E29F6C|nr:hypothetical protein [Cyclobacterium sp. 1_MG-2023]MDO6440469.1 hypothetical protein [Cyclobacterium sp. 1_MG-2023]